MNVEETVVAPLTIKPDVPVPTVNKAPMLDEALDTKPPWNAANDVTIKVDETVVAPLTIKPAAALPTFNNPTTDEEALEMKPLVSVAKLATLKVLARTVAPVACNVLLQLQQLGLPSGFRSLVEWWQLCITCQSYAQTNLTSFELRN
ncbi:MAG: hypothetical protein EXS55_02530 [Candidatus Magasanikbacteria bacterium]|nr:hypothetical protein [Candidatus Magasanikbacteria bacterium]